MLTTSNKGSGHRSERSPLLNASLCCHIVRKYNASFLTLTTLLKGCVVKFIVWMRKLRPGKIKKLFANCWSSEWQDWDLNSCLFDFKALDLFMVKAWCRLGTANGNAPRGAQRAWICEQCHVSDHREWSDSQWTGDCMPCLIACKSKIRKRSMQAKRNNHPVFPIT